MPYLIDANNLAGKLGILDESDWDQKLIRMIQDYCEQNNKKVILVFDSSDSLGDRYAIGNVSVIYTPRDAVYSNADDKIIELMKNEKRPEDWVVISDDLRILDEANKLDIKTILARDFAKKLMPPEESPKNEDELSANQQKEINDELLEEWG